MPPAAYGRSCPKAKVAHKKLAGQALRRFNVINFKKRRHFLSYRCGYVIKRVCRVVLQNNAGRFL
jgi:hypothetical protein